jgi:hypothetical protein
MATVLEECSTKKQRSVVRFLWAEGLIAKDVHKEMSSVYVVKCLSRKWFTTGPRNCHLGGTRFADDVGVETEVRKWLRQQSKDFYAAGFDALVKRWDKLSMLVEVMSRNICFSFYRLEYHMFYVLYPIMTYLLTLPCK